MADYENGVGINQLQARDFRLIHCSMKFGLDLFEGDNVPTSYLAMVSAFTLFKGLISEGTPWTIVMVHVMPAMIGKCMKAMVEAGLANMDNKQATRLVIWQ